MDEEQKLTKVEIAELEIDPPGEARLVTGEELAAFHRSIADEQAFDGAFGRLMRATATLEQQLDEMLADLIATPTSAEAFWAIYLERRGLSRKADDLKSLVARHRQRVLTARTGRVVAEIKRVAKRRNDLVHQIVSVGLPLDDDHTEFTLFRRVGSGGSQQILTAPELEALVGEVETVFLRLLSLQQALTRAEDG